MFEVNYISVLLYVQTQYDIYLWGIT